MKWEDTASGQKKKKKKSVIHGEKGENFFFFFFKYTENSHSPRVLIKFDPAVLIVWCWRPDWLLRSSSDWMGPVSVHWLKDKTRNSFIVVDAGEVNEQGVAGSREFSQRFFPG